MSVLTGPRRKPARDEYAQELANWGISDPDADEVLGQRIEDDPEVWPEQTIPLELFAAMRTQWRSSGFGMVGLDYGPLPLVARSLGLTDEQLTGAFRDLQIMEDAALCWFAEQGARTDG